MDTTTLSRIHRVSLPGTPWSLWRDLALRSAGFPAHDVLLLRDAAISAAADAFSAEQLGADAYRQAFTAATERSLDALAEIARYPLFREAVAWQNPNVLTNTLDRLLEKRSANASTRSKQVRVAAYLQRYALKNDSIGFFGPITWATFDDELETFIARPGPALVSRRATHFEVWAIDAVGHAFARTPGVEPWLKPERAPGSILIDGVLYRARRRPQELGEVEVQIWQACDGQTCLKDIVGGGPDADARRAALDGLRKAEAIIVDLEGFVSIEPEAELRRKLEQLGAEPQRTELLAKLDELDAAREALDRARGSDEVKRAILHIEALFRAFTGGEETSRRHGQMYAGRTLVYQDTLRDLELVVGKVVLAELARPLGLILDSVRWLVGRAAEIYCELLAEQVRGAVARLGRNDVPLGYLITCMTPDLFETDSGDPPAPMQKLLVDFQARWSRILGSFPQEARALELSGAQIAEAVAREFPFMPSPWPGANTHSPDLMVAAPSAEAIAAGEFLLVLGELHLARNTLESRCFVELHPDSARLVAAQEADMPGGRVVCAFPKDSPFITSRCAPPTAILPPTFTYWTWSDTRMSTDAPGPVVPGGDLYACEGPDGVVVRSRSSGQSFDLLYVLGEALSTAVLNAFRPFARGAHQPRITIDKMVIQRESWTCQMKELEWVALGDEAASFAAARRWRARLGLPERVFVRVPGEIKPMALDFASPVLVRMLGRSIRRSLEAGHETVTLTEMLPTLEQAWLADAQGRRYTSEFRVVAVDERDGQADG